MPDQERLADVLSEFVRTLVTDFPIQSILDHLVERIVEVLPVTAAGVTLIAPGRNPRYVAASNASALRYEKLQTLLGEGPCLVAYRTGEAVSVPDLREDVRFPRFGPLAVEAGLIAVFTFPLRHGDARLGALDLYRSTPGPLDVPTMKAAQTLADVAAAYLLNAQARADLRAASERSHQTNLHDSLTGLPNRVLLLERLEHAVHRARRSGKAAAVLFVDLDRFKVVNDMYGHSVGDQLLVAVAQRLIAVLRPGDTLARLSGDEFVILCEDVDGNAHVTEIAARIGKAIAVPVTLSGHKVFTTASVGIAFSGPGDQLCEQLLDEADSAMYQAKRKGGARQQIVDLREQSQAAQRASLEHDLHGALERRELRTEYQPIVDTCDGQITGVEALVRWEHPSRGLIPPTLLIPLAERSRLITEIGRWVLESGCGDGRRWHNNHHPDTLTMAVNVSAIELMEPGYAATVANVLSETDTDPDLVTLEMTEGIFLQDGERALVVLRELQRLGVRIALDDFGTGYSSLNYLKQFPIDIVKIDKTFVADLEHDQPSRFIVSAVIELAHRLNMSVVAEGVETVEQLRQLTSLGCDCCQGYYFAYPMPADDLENLFRNNVVNGTAHLPALATKPQLGRHN